MKIFYRSSRRSYSINATILSAALCMLLTAPSWADRVAGPTKTGKVGIPQDLFITSVPADAVDVADARKSAEEGKPIVMRGQVGGLAKPFAEKYAMFVMVDRRLAPCSSSCSNQGDFCSIPRDQLVANMATIQVVDGNGAPLKASVQGLNGLRLLSEVVIQGTVAKRDNNVMIVNAKSIYVNNKLAVKP